MANTPQARKRARQNTTRRSRNMAARSRMRTSVKKVRLAVEAGELDNARECLVKATAILDTEARKGLIHKNKAARLKSRLNTLIKTAAAA